jgi:hypothetical protein
MNQATFRIVDIALFAIANLVNLLVIGIFLSRPKRLERVEYVLGLVLEALALPIGAAVVLNVLGQREWWRAVLPSLLILFLVVEGVLDYILKLDFRRTRLLAPYLVLFYLGLIGILGYTFAVGKMYGLITLGTYLLGLAATGYSYSKVGHG